MSQHPTRANLGRGSKGENMRHKLTTAMAVCLAAGTANAESVKIGFVTTLTTPAAVIGKDMENAVNLAVEHLGGKAGDVDLEVIFGDDGFAPETGKQATDKLVKQDDVDFVAGYIWSHVLLASSKSVLDEGRILISANAGPSQLAGKRCHPNFFNVSWQNDQTPEAMGEVLNQLGIKSIYVMAPNYAAGKDMTFAEALGVKAGNPDRAVVAVVGDGGFMFGVQELATAAQHGINVVSVVFTLLKIRITPSRKISPSFSIAWKPLITRIPPSASAADCGPRPIPVRSGR